MNTDTQNFQTENNPASNLQGIATSLRAKKHRRKTRVSNSNISILCNHINFNILG
ncbi:hypothetical protein CFL1_01380 [Lactobacillus delbrueckii subsp. bulgaricus]|nr:hypothetical protein CFL1_01380 [Lactobacillus delbrueckii subsp. bulgaricus]